jgi:hypothetical protein
MSAFQTGPDVWFDAGDSPRSRPPEAHIDADLPAPQQPPVAAPAQSVTPTVSGPVTPPTARPKVQRGNGRGLTAAGVAVIVLAGSVLGAIIDTTVGDDLGPCFAVLFVATSLYTATTVRRRDFLAAVITPPLVFLLIIGVHELLAPSGHSRAFIDLTGDLLSALALDAPTLWVGTVVAAAVVFVRHRRRS